MTVLTVAACGPANGVYNANGSAQTIISPGTVAGYVDTSNNGSSNPAQSNTGAAQSNTGTTQSNTGTAQSNTGTTQSNTGTTQSNTGTTQSNTGTTQSNTGATQSNTGTAQSNTGTSTQSVTTLGSFTAQSGVAVGTVYGPTTTDGFVAVYGELDGRGGQAIVRVKAGASPSALADFGHGYMYNNGWTYLGTAQLLVPVPMGSYYQVVCDTAFPCPGGTAGYIGGPVIYYQPIQSTTGASVFGTREAMAIGPLYGPAPTDGFVMAYGRLDKRGGLGTLAVNTGDASQQNNRVAYGTSYNDGTNYLGSYQLMAPIHKGDYYRLVCDGQFTCPSYTDVGDFLAYFQPVGSATTLAFGTGVNKAVGGVYSAPTDGLVFLYGQSDNVANSWHSLQLDAGFSNLATVLGWGASWNQNNASAVGYFGNWQIKAPLRAGQSFQALCDGTTACSNGSIVGQQLFYFLPTTL